MQVQVEFIKMLIISAAVGGLIGIERELKVEVVAGMRTFMLVAILGAVSTSIAEMLGSAVILLGFLGTVLLTFLVGVIKNYKLEDIGVTTPVAFLITFVLGILVGSGFYLESIAASIIVTGILVSKKYSKELSDTLSHEEIINALEFGLIVFVLYPVAPSKPIDPLNLINPKILILVIILVASIGFAGFLVLRRIGAKKGLPVVGALGGLINSEATASALSARTKEREELISGVLLGIILANAAMLARNLVIVGFISAEVLKFMVLPQTAMIFGSLIYAFFKLEKMQGEAEISLESPFAIMPAVKFAVLFAFVSFVVTYLKHFGAGSIYFVSLLGGLVSSAAVTASVAAMAADGSLGFGIAATAGVISALGSTAGKVIIARVNGTSALADKLAKPLFVSFALGLIVLVIQSVM